MTWMKRRSPRRAWSLGAAAALVMSVAVAFLALLSSAPADASTAGVRSSGLRYPLLPITAAPSAAVPALAAVIGPSPHGPYIKTTDDCATCHRTHIGQNKNLIKSFSPKSNLCYTCHDGTGAAANVKAQFDDPLVPANDVANRVYYRHDTIGIGTTAHTSSGKNEFGGVSNRHSECGDCHNPHQAIGTDGTTTAPTSTGVTASGRLAGMSGVSVVNGATDTIPAASAYTFLDGKTPATSITREYQLCFKCHSGFTTLLPDGTSPVSRYRLDKAAEFNPNNLSYHPIEAPGKNTSAAMAASLAGPSPYKIWNFTTASTIRCVNCHASSTKYTQAPVSPSVPVLNDPPPNGDLPMHTSRNAGILLKPYRNRLLKGSEGYSDADFALCLMCHSNAPFANDGGGQSSTNFGFHGYHTAALSRGSAGGSIDTPGAGQGNALCAECHYRQHSTTFKPGSQTITGSKLVSFAPNVKPYGTTLNWSSTGLAQGTCTLTCHGITHTPKTYNGPA